MWGICLKKYEIESFLKSFFLFFLSQTLLVGGLFFINYQKEIQTLNETLFSKMRVCSYTLACEEFAIDFVPQKGFEPYKLYTSNTELSAYFPIGGSEKNYLKLYLTQEKYRQKVVTLQKTLLRNFVLVLLVIALLSFVFSLYALSPLRNALRLTEEFIKDILHDFNTPLTTLRLNLDMLQAQLPQEVKIQRAHNAIQNILNLQNNLRAYLHSHTLQKERFDLAVFLKQRVALLEKNYQDITFDVAVDSLELFTNKDAFGRIIDNLLSNAAKYNTQGGNVTLSLHNTQLLIQDTGKGIRNPSKVFQRFYKEQERGIGIGLHIVKKLCEELGIEIDIKSEIGTGSTILLTITPLIQK